MGLVGKKDYFLSLTFGAVESETFPNFQATYADLELVYGKKVQYAIFTFTMTSK